VEEIQIREFAALRETIRARGGARPLAFLAGIGLWALALTVVLIWLPNPLASMVPLLVLTTTFEVIRTLHMGVERIGRYVQVFFEERPRDLPMESPAWETTAMAFGPAVPGAGGHPLFLPLVLMATIVNYLAVVFPGPIVVELWTLAVPHLAFMVWTLFCDRAMRKQRATELARFRELRKGGRS